MKARQILLTLFATISLAFVANAQAKAEGNETPEGLYMTKTVTKDPANVNSYMLQLESFVTGVTIPGGNADVMFILDISGSMIDTKHPTTDKLSQLKKATKSFIDVLAKTESRMSMVTFGLKSKTKLETDFIAVKGNTDYLNSIVDTLSDRGSTEIGNAVKIGLDTFKKSSATGTPKFCIILTDGMPGTMNEGDYSIAQETWDAAYSMKHDLGIKVYTIFLGTEGKNTKFENHTDGYLMDVTNFLDGTSSNFPQARWNCCTSSKIDNIKGYWVSGERGKKSEWQWIEDKYKLQKTDDKYFIDVPDPENLSKVFNEIAKEVAASLIDLNAENSKIIDKISNDFSLPANAFDAGGNLDKSKISLYALHCTGMSGDTYTFDEANPVTLPNTDTKYSALGFAGVDVNLAPDKKTLTVTGFDFEKNFVAWTDARKDGYKLVIKIPVIIDPKGVGGMNVPTNDPESGIYYDEKKVGDFKEIGEYPVPHTDLPNIIVKKNGLKQGESATFNVYKEGEKANAIALVITQGEGESSVVKIKLEETGRYVVEETDWSWAYTTACTSTYTKDDGNTSTTANSITRNVNSDTQDETLKGTVFEFINTAKESTPAHAEANINNEFKTIQ